MKLNLKRTARKETYTIGKLYVDGIKLCDTLEDKDRGLKSSMSVEEIRTKKVYGQTAIPTGKYNVILSISQKFSSRSWARQYGGKIPEILNVKGFNGIRIHPLNTAADSLGCIGVGINDTVGRISQSQRFFSKLMEKLIAATNHGEQITLEVE